MNHPYMYPEDAPWTPEAIQLDMMREERARRQMELQILQEDEDFNSRFARRPGR